MAKWRAWLFVLGILIAVIGANLVDYYWPLFLTSGSFAVDINVAKMALAVLLMVTSSVLFKVHLSFKWRSLWWALLLGLPILSIYVVGYLRPSLAMLPDIWLFQNFRPLIPASILHTMMTAFSEEVVFHGVLFGVIYRIFANSRWPLWQTVIVTNGLFALTHLTNAFGQRGALFPTIYNVLFVFGWSVAITIVMIIGRSLWAPIIIHFLTDIVPLTLAYAYPGDGSPTPDYPFNPGHFFQSLALMAVFLVLAVVYAVIWEWWRKRHPLVEEAYPF